MRRWRDCLVATAAVLWAFNFGYSVAEGDHQLTTGVAACVLFVALTFGKDAA